MSESYLIDGVGDEVTVILGIFIAIFVVIVSWLSTRVGDGGQYEVNITANAAAEIIGSRQSQQTNANVTEGVTSENVPAASTQSTGTNASPAQGSDSNVAASGDLPSTSSSQTSVESTSQQDVIDDQAIPSTSNTLRQRRAADTVGVENPDGMASASDKSSTSENSPSTSQAAQGSLPVRLKFMDDTVRTVRAQPDDTLEHFRRQHLPADTVHRYRLIFQGQVLRDVTQTLRQLRVIPRSSQGGEDSAPVIHCFLSPAISTEDGRQATSASHQLELVAEDLHIGSLLLPLLGLALVCLWYLCIFHTSLFSIQSVVSIVGFSLLYIALFVNQFLL